MVAQEVAADKGAEQGIDDQEGAAQVQAAQAAAQAAQGREALQRFAQPGQHTQGGLRLAQEVGVAVHAVVYEGDVGMGDGVAAAFQHQAHQCVLVAVLCAARVEGQGQKHLAVEQDVERGEVGVGMLLAIGYRAAVHGRFLVAEAQFAAPGADLGIAQFATDDVGAVALGDIPPQEVRGADQGVAVDDEAIIIACLRGQEVEDACAAQVFAAAQVAHVLQCGKAGVLFLLFKIRAGVVRHDDFKGKTFGRQLFAELAALFVQLAHQGAAVVVVYGDEDGNHAGISLFFFCTPSDLFPGN